MPDPTSVGYRPTINSKLSLDTQMKLDTEKREAQKEKSKIFEEIEEGKLITEEDLAELDYTEVMDTKRFLELARTVLLNADKIIDRADFILSKLTPTDPVTLLNPEVVTEDYSLLFGSELPNPLPAKMVDCIVRLAAKNPLEKELTEYVPSNTNPTVATAALNSVLNQSKLLFPKFGIKLILMLFWIIFKMAVKLQLGQMCKFFGKLPLIGGAIESAIDAVSYALIKEGSCGSKPNINNIFQYELNRAQRAILSGEEYDPFGRDDPVDKCDPNYSPTIQEIALARNIATEIYKSELGNEATITSKSTETSLVSRLRSEAVSYKVIGGDIVENLEASPGVYHVDKIRGSFLGLFSTMNGVLKGIDMGLSGIVQLEFMQPKAREWVCCFARVFYIYLPALIKKMHGNPADVKKLYDFYSGKADWKLGKKEQLIIEALDSILGYLMGSSAINIDLEFPFDTDLIMGALYSAIAEALALVSEMLYQTIGDGMKKIGLHPDTKDPLARMILDMCPPFNYFLNLIICNINDFYMKIMDMLSMLWLRGNEMMKSFDSTFEVMIMSRNIKLFKNLFKLLSNLGVRLQHFCDLDQITTRSDVQAILKEIDTGFPSTSNLTPEEMAKMAPIIRNLSIPAGPDADAYINTRLLRTDSGAGSLDVNIFNSPFYAGARAKSEDLDKKVDIVTSNTPMSPDGRSSISEGSIDEGSVMELCGEPYKDLLRKLVL